MSDREQALDLLQRYYTAFNGGDREGFLDLLGEGVVHDINQGGSEIGRPAFRDFLTRMDRCYAEQVEELVTFATDDGRRGAAEFFISGKYLVADEGLPPATGQTYRLRVGAFFEFAQGKVQRITNYYNLGEWLRQVGAGQQG